MASNRLVSKLEDSGRRTKLSGPPALNPRALPAKRHRYGVLRDLLLLLGGLGLLVLAILADKFTPRTPARSIDSAISDHAFYLKGTPADSSP